MINLELQIKAKGLTPQQEEEFRMFLRRESLSWLFTKADMFGQMNKLDFDHTELGVTGEIKVHDEPTAS